MSFDFPSSELLQLQAVVKSRIRLCIFCRILCNTKCSSIAETASLTGCISFGQTAGWVTYGQKWKAGTRRQYFTDIIGLSSTTVT